eukprot:m.86202 g.86202  ORF g.86202 m.86202 type:complete len:117 (-) comp14457_c0_seq1:1057-1407(-)
MFALPPFLSTLSCPTFALPSPQFLCSLCFFFLSFLSFLSFSLSFVYCFADARTAPREAQVKGITIPPSTLINDHWKRRHSTLLAAAEEQASRDGRRDLRPRACARKHRAHADDAWI